MTWEKPELEELDVELTANGMYNTTVETLVLFNDSDRTLTES